MSCAKGICPEDEWDDYPGFEDDEPYYGGPDDPDDYLSEADDTRVG